MDSDFLFQKGIKKLFFIEISKIIYEVEMNATVLSKAFSPCKYCSKSYTQATSKCSFQDVTAMAGLETLYPSLLILTIE